MSEGICVRREYAICFVLAVVTVALYWPVNHFGFTNYDDPVYVTQNHTVLQGLTAHGLSWALSTGWTGNWHPITWFSHMLDCQLYGHEPRGHHLTNLVFHVANTLLLFGLLRWMTKAVWRSALVAGLFAWHPMHVESVAWVAERKDVLSTFFGLLAVAAYFRYVTESRLQSPEYKVEDTKLRPAASKISAEVPNQKSEIKNQKYAYLLSLLCFALGLMSKPMLVTLPFVLLLLDWWPLERYSISNFRPRTSRSESLTRIILEKVPFLMLVLVSSVITFLVQQKGGNVASLELVSLPARLANLPVAYLSYAARLFWPKDLCALYPFVVPSPETATGAAFCLLAGVVAVIFLGRSRPYVVLGCLWFVGMLVPVIGVVQVGSQAMADRYTYLPSVGLFIAIAWGLGELATRWPLGRSAIIAAACAALAGCIWSTHNLLPCWRDSIALFERVLAVKPDNPIALCNMANALMTTGRFEESMARLQKALAIKPDMAPAEAGIGWCLLQQGKPEEAAVHYRSALRWDPRLPDACGNLAWILATSPDEKQRDGVEAVRLGEVACALSDNQNPLFLTYLAAAYAEAGQFDKAIATDLKSHALAVGAGDQMLGENTEKYLELYRAHRVIRAGPDPAAAACEAAQKLAANGRIVEAVARYRETLHLDSNNVTALNNLAWILAADSNAGNRAGTEAVELAERACELTHYEEPLVIGTLAAAYAQAGQFPKAIEAGEKARALFAKSGRTDLAETNRVLDELYRQGKVYPLANLP